MHSREDTFRSKNTEAYLIKVWQLRKSSSTQKKKRNRKCITVVTFKCRSLKKEKRAISRTLMATKWQRSRQGWDLHTSNPLCTKQILRISRNLTALKQKGNRGHSANQCLRLGEITNWLNRTTSKKLRNSLSNFRKQGSIRGCKLLTRRPGGSKTKLWNKISKTLQRSMRLGGKKQSVINSITWHWWTKS